MGCHSAKLRLPDWGMWGSLYTHGMLPFSHWMVELPPLYPLPNFSHCPLLHGPSQVHGFPKASSLGTVTQFTMAWESLALGSCSVRLHWLFVICSRHVSNVSSVPRQSLDLRVRWQHQPHKVYFGFEPWSGISADPWIFKQGPAKFRGLVEEKWG